MCALLLYTHTHTHNLSPSLTTTEPSLLHFFCICHPGACQCLTPSHAVTHTHICTHAAIFLYKKKLHKVTQTFFFTLLSVLKHTYTNQDTSLDRHSQLEQVL